MNQRCRLRAAALIIFGILMFSAGQVFADSPQRIKGVPAGACATCHTDKNVLPQGHIDTSSMDLNQCQTCHQHDDTPLNLKLPTSHVHTLSGVSCEKCHGTGQEMEIPEMTTCTACHDPEKLAEKTEGEHGDNPHRSPHYGTDLDCTLCHYQHEPADNFCAQCHDDIFKTPSPMMPLTSLDKKIDNTNMDCSTCHSGPRFEEHFKLTGHGNLSCTDCHTGITDFGAHMAGKAKPQTVSCASCHRDIEKVYKGSYHEATEHLSCTDCHTDIHPEKTPAGDEKDLVARCTRCHEDDMDAMTRGHTASFMNGNKDAATCRDCHGVHDTLVFADTKEGQAAKRKHYSEQCIACHSDEEMAKRNDMNPMTVEQFEDTYHGKVFALGYTDKVAGCTDCHTPHNILPADNPDSALSPENMEKTCAECHEDFHPRFVSFIAHPDENDKDHYLALYITRIFMVCLLAGVFIFFWLHSILWWRKAYWEKCRLRKAGLKHKPTDLPETEANQYVRRFSMRDRIMHIVLVLSFLGIVISGFPLKYHDAPWASWLISILGGVKGAGLMHRTCGIAMWGLFLYTFWLSLKFIFPGGHGRGWWRRLVGPDSLFPRWKDFRDCWGMFKWFFGKGEIPQFDRWTYWEKFDFFAVFWGMFVIGLSGLTLMFPEEASHLMPGWMINVCTLAHSEEAFLAAIFIFTVHFFNNHLVPGKFPLETNVFTGKYTLAALKEERPVEYERILAENRLEEMKCTPPSTASQLFAGVFGLTTYILGLVLAVLIFWAVL